MCFLEDSYLMSRIKKRVLHLSSSKLSRTLVRHVWVSSKVESSPTSHVSRLTPTTLYSGRGSVNSENKLNQG